MSLLNDALRKKNMELKQPKSTGLFNDAPDRENDMKKYIIIVLSAITCAVIVWFGWQTFFDPGASLIVPDLAGNNETGAEVDASAVKVDAGQTTRDLTEVKESPKPVLPVMEKRQSYNDDGLIPVKIGGQKNEALKPMMPLAKADEVPPIKKAGIKKAPAPQKANKPGSYDVSKSPFYLKAVDYHRRNEFQKAIQMYQEVLRKNPGNYDTLFNLASAYLNISSFKEAHMILERLRQSDPKNPQILLNLAIAEIGLGRPKKAIFCLDDAAGLEVSPQFEIYLHKGVALSKLDMLDEALIWYKKARQFNPDHPQLLFNIAVVYDRLGRYPEALNYYRAFLKTAGGASDQEKMDVENRIKSIKAHVAGQSSVTDQ